VGHVFLFLSMQIALNRHTRRLHERRTERLAEGEDALFWDDLSPRKCTCAGVAAHVDFLVSCQAHAAFVCGQFGEVNLCAEMMYGAITAGRAPAC